MPEQKNNKDYSKFDQMSTDALEEILRLDELFSDEDSDMDTILYVMEVIAKREREHPTGKYTDIHSAWLSFKENYLPYIDDGKSLYEEEPVMPLQSDILIAFSADSNQKQPKGKNYALLRMVCMVSIFAFLFFVGTVTSYAFGYDLWKLFAQWTKETFNFSLVVPMNHQEGYYSLQDALSDYGITEPLVPTWIPDGYAIHSVDVSETPAKIKFLAVYKNDGSELTIGITETANSNTNIYEKDDYGVTAYEVDGIKHYIMTNNGWKNVVWVYKSYECFISGNLSESNIRKMIDSIYER